MLIPQDLQRPGEQWCSSNGFKVLLQQNRKYSSTVVWRCIAEEQQGVATVQQRRRVGNGSGSVTNWSGQTKRRGRRRRKRKESYRRTNGTSRPNELVGQPKTEVRQTLTCGRAVQQRDSWAVSGTGRGAAGRRWSQYYPVRLVATVTCIMRLPLLSC